LDQVESFGCKLVEFTGGEPLEQREVYSLMKELITRGYTVLVETGGHMDISHIPEEAHIIMDVKCPGSGMCARNHAANLTGLSHKDEVKFVLSDEADFYWACEQVRNHALCERTQVLFSCVSGKIEPVWVAEQILKTGLNIRFQLQLHKILWDPSRRSV
jgi:7-carboxy-7-deazaguanine synthase